MSRKNRGEEVGLDQIWGDPVYAAVHEDVPATRPDRVYIDVDPQTNQLIYGTEDRGALYYMTPEEEEMETQRYAEARRAEFLNGMSIQQTSADPNSGYEVTLSETHRVSFSHPDAKGLAAEMLAGRIRERALMTLGYQALNGAGASAELYDGARSQSYNPGLRGQVQQGEASVDDYAPSPQQPMDLPTVTFVEGGKKKSINIKKLVARTMLVAAGASASFGVMSWTPPFYGPQHTLWSEFKDIPHDVEAVLNQINGVQPRGNS